MDTTAQNPSPAPAPAAALEQAQGVIETASGFAPSSLSPIFSFVLGALAMLVMVLGVQKAVRQRKARSKHPCIRCHGSGEEPKDKAGMVACDECDGTGQIEEEEEQSVECKHCGGEGEDPCHVCKGKGTLRDGTPCAACKGGGKTLTGKLDKKGEPLIADCEICRGEGEVSVTVKKKSPCKKCGGTGKLRAED